jgi:hypothetical protein
MFQLICIYFASECPVCIYYRTVHVMYSVAAPLLGPIWDPNEVRKPEKGLSRIMRSNVYEIILSCPPPPTRPFPWLSGLGRGGGRLYTTPATCLVPRRRAGPAGREGTLVPIFPSFHYGSCFVPYIHTACTSSLLHNFLPLRFSMTQTCTTFIICLPCYPHVYLLLTYNFTL